MGFVVVCPACGKRLSIPERLYDTRVRGRVVTIDCKACGQAVHVDGTLPPPAASEPPSVGGSATDQESDGRVSLPDIPRAGALPQDWMVPGSGSVEGSRLPLGSGSGLELPPNFSREGSGAKDRPLTARDTPSSRPPSGTTSAPPSVFPAGTRRSPIVGATSAAAVNSVMSELALFPAPLRAETADSQSPGLGSDLDDGVLAPSEEPISVRAPVAKIGRYALFGQFASGGMATVHLGRLDGAGGFSRVVAIKRLLPQLVKNLEFTEMLMKEARLAARVRHPNVIPMLDVVASKGDVLLVMEYVHGEALSALCRTQARQRKAPFPVDIAVSVMHDTLQGLHAVHEASDERGRPLGLVHRDVSPQNVMVGVEGVARVFDFGVAKALEHVEETIPNRLKGKTGYMSPEQIRGERLTRRSDVFCAGIVLWELLTLRRLFSGTTDAERMDKIISGRYPRPSLYRPVLPPELDAVVMCALSVDAEHRYETALDFAEALEKAAAGASARTVADWVMGLAEGPLAERAKMVGQVESWEGGGEHFELSSSAFAADTSIVDRRASGEPTDGSGASFRPPANSLSGESSSVLGGLSGFTLGVGVSVMVLLVVVVLVAALVR